jgi:hypothetical protein
MICKNLFYLIHNTPCIANIENIIPIYEHQSGILFIRQTGFAGQSFAGSGMDIAAALIDLMDNSGNHAIV